MNKELAAIVSILIILSVALSYFWFGIHILAGTPKVSSARSYTIRREGIYYTAKNDFSGVDDFSDSNFTHVFEQVLCAIPADDSGTIHLEPGYYEGWMVINRSGITVQGGGVFSDNPQAFPNGTSGLPDDSPQNLMGTVLNVSVAGKDGIHLAGQLNGVQISDLGIQFTQNITGNGISDDMDQNYHLSYCTFENIKVLNHDKSHYAIQLSNFLHLDIHDIYAWGGPLLNLYGNKQGFQSGNSNFYNMYGYIKYDLAPVQFADGPYPIFVHKNDSLNSVWVNFLHFYTIQINCPFNQTDTTFYEVTLWDCRDSTFDGLDLEGSGNTFEGNKLRMSSCYNVQFNNAYMWSMANNLYVNIASNNGENTFEDCRISMGTLLDSCPTDTWLSCTIDATIHPDTLAKFVDLPGNSGIATLTAGNSEVNVTAKFIGKYYSVSISNSTQIQVEAIYQAPTNSFTVTCTDGKPADNDTGFKWSVIWWPPP